MTAVFLLLPAGGTLVYAGPGDSERGRTEGEFRYPETERPAISRYYAMVKGGEVPVFADPSHSEQGLPPLRFIPDGFIGVSIRDDYPVLWKGQAWYRINDGEFVRAENLKFVKPPLFQGVTVPPYFDKSLAWLVFDVRASKNPGEPPPPDAPEIPGQSLAIIYEVREIDGRKWCRIEGGWWLEYRKLGLVQASPRPGGIGKNEKWIEVNIFEQTLTAYEGDRMIFTTLVSTGKGDYPTVTGLFRIWVKSGMSKMSGGGGSGEYYYLEDVPWQMYFYQSYALHANYWHGYFGIPTSHGCINLSPNDAKWLYDWSGPRAGQGNWTNASGKNPGTWVWVH
jgi:hypothetical protein